MHNAATGTKPVNFENEIAQLFHHWNTALGTGDPDQVIKTYASDAVLLPTVSNRVRHNHDEIKDYFQSFLTLKPQGKIDEQNIRVFGDLAINSGVYTFALTRAGQPAQVQARYTFVYRKMGGQWLIAEHHSSAMPEPVNNH